MEMELVLHSMDLSVEESFLENGDAPYDLGGS